jgi:hypothetical protein
MSKRPRASASAAGVSAESWSRRTEAARPDSLDQDDAGVVDVIRELGADYPGAALVQTASRGNSRSWLVSLLRATAVARLSPPREAQAAVEVALQSLRDGSLASRRVGWDLLQLHLQCEDVEAAREVAERRLATFEAENSATLIANAFIRAGYFDDALFLLQRAGPHARARRLRSQVSSTKR